jgi:hypothetical protein
LWEKSPPAVADPVALRQGAIQQDVVRVRLAQGAQQAGRAVGEQVDDGCRVGVGGADGDTEPCGELGEGVVPMQVHQPDQSTLVRQELAAAVTLAGDDEHGDPGLEGTARIGAEEIDDRLAGNRVGRPRG